jgi:hypothetical protein
MKEKKKITWTYYSCLRVDDSSIVKIENTSCKDYDAHTIIQLLVIRSIICNYDKLFCQVS